MTGTDEFGHELDAQGYEPAAPQGGGAAGPLGAPRLRGPQPVGRPMQGQVPLRPLAPNPVQAPMPAAAAPQGAPWVAGQGAAGHGYAEAAFGPGQHPSPGMPVEMEIDATAPQPRLVMPAPGPGHDAPTAEFFPLYDAGSPEDYEVPPAVPAPQPQAQPAQQPVRPTLGVPAQQPRPGFAPQAGPVPPQQPAPYVQQLPQDPEEPAGYPEQPAAEGLSASASWSAAPPRAAQAVRPAQPQRPAVPAQPMPAPEPLPERGAARSGVRNTGGGIAAAGAVAAGRAAVRQQQADAAGQTETDPLGSSGQRAVPAQAVQVPQVPQQAPSVFDSSAPRQPQPQPQQYQDPQSRSGQHEVPQGPASPGSSGVRDTMAPPRRRVPAAAPEPATPGGPDDLSSANLRSVAPSVPAPRRVPEDSAGDLPLPQAQQQPAPQSAPQPTGRFAEQAQDNDELVVPWGAVAQPGEQSPRGTRRRAETGVDDAVPEPVQFGRPVLLDPEPGEEEDFAERSGSYEPAFAEPEQNPVQPPEPEQPEHAADEDPLSGSGSHARPQQPQVQPQPAQQQPAPQQQEQEQPQVLAQVPLHVEQPQPAAPQQPEPRRQPKAQPQPVAQPQPQVEQPQPAAQQPVQQQPQVEQPQVEQPRPAAQQQPQAQPQVQQRPQAQQPEPRRQPKAQPQPQSAPVQQPVQQQAQAPEPVEPPVAQPAKPARKTPAPAAPAAPAAAVEADRAPGYAEAEMEAVYRVIHERRDIRNDFLPDELPVEVLTRILEAAHTAPSVGFSQPWDFLVLRDEDRRRAVHDLAARQRKAYAASLPKARAKAFAALKIEAILETPVNIVVTCDPTRGGRHTLGRYTQPMMAPFSTCLAVENLWLAARAEGLGVGWVSFFDERELAETLGLPEHLQIVAYLCVGYVKRFPEEPELAGAGWARRRPLSWAVHEEDYGRRGMPGAEPVSLLDATVDAVRGLDEDAAAAARERQGRMTKPPGSLGQLEHVAEQLAGLSGECPPPLPEPAALAVFAADHGVHAQGVTPWPQEVTAQMVSNFLSGGAVVNAFAKQVGAEVCVVDVGVNANLGNASGLVPRKVRFGTADMTQGPAMSREEAMAAIEAGIETARDLVAAGNRCLLTGDMGIANTTASAALIAAFTGASPAQVTGYGTGIDEQTYAHKVEIVRRALELHRPDPQDPIGVLAAFGGLEHAALAGFILGGAALRIPVVLDGVIAGAAALVAQAIAPEVTVACVAGHRSAEPGHALALEALGVNPLIDLELRLGEGSGAVLALPLVAAAVRALREVATFDAAGVADASAEAVAVPPRGRE
ncbi:MAG TPA: nicotinate-nucleotide--dimethylbenzimidazole phosphoribosyltransferase [Actinospica sp.]|nr:nicotinate-nucleotide--dimethylbenzimidazole phosphoribosyltransferase [Actinospica sp.]